MSVMRAMALYEKQQGREIDEVERHVFRSAYAMGVLDNQSDNAIPAGKLRDALADLVDYDFCYVGGEANTEDPRSLWNRVKRARAILEPGAT